VSTHGETEKGEKGWSKKGSGASRGKKKTFGEGFQVPSAVGVLSAGGKGKKRVGWRELPKVERLMGVPKPRSGKTGEGSLQIETLGFAPLERPPQD